MLSPRTLHVGPSPSLPLYEEAFPVSDEAGDDGASGSWRDRCWLCGVTQVRLPPHHLPGPLTLGEGGVCQVPIVKRSLPLRN